LTKLWLGDFYTFRAGIEKSQRVVAAQSLIAFTGIRCVLHFMEKMRETLTRAYVQNWKRCRLADKNTIQLLNFHFPGLRFIRSSQGPNLPCSKSCISYWRGTRRFEQRSCTDKTEGRRLGREIADKLAVERADVRW